MPLGKNTSADTGFSPDGLGLLWRNDREEGESLACGAPPASDDDPTE